MSREVKFMAWLPAIKKMTYAHTLDDLITWGVKEDTRGCIWRQFTGLTDKNGKEIYEGDIVKTEDGGLAKPESTLAVKYSGAAFVIYDPNCCEICKKGSGCISNLDEWRADKYIVIGNIYQHPELLTIDHSPLTS